MGTQPLPQKGRSPTQFSALVYCGQTAAWIKMPHGGRPRPTRHCVRCGPSYPQKKRHTHPTQFLAHVYCGQMAGWMKTPLGTEVNLCPGHTLLDGVPGPRSRERGTAAPLFLAHVCCGYGRPSQLLLSSCSIFANLRYLLSPSVRLSVVCLPEKVVHPTQAVVNFGNFSTAFGTLAIDSHIKFHGDRPRGTPPSGELNPRRIAKYSDFEPIEARLYLGNGARYRR